MPRFLIDVNLPYRFSLWRGDDFVHVRDIDDRLKDRQVWEYARERDMVIVSKDADFSNLVMSSSPPPRVVHVRLGNMRMREFHAVLHRYWPWVVANISRFRLIRIYPERIEGIADDSSPGD